MAFSVMVEGPPCNVCIHNGVSDRGDFCQFPLVTPDFLLQYLSYFQIQKGSVFNRVSFSVSVWQKGVGDD